LAARRVGRDGRNQAVRVELRGKVLAFFDLLDARAGRESLRHGLGPGGNGPQLYGHPAGIPPRSQIRRRRRREPRARNAAGAPGTAGIMRAAERVPKPPMALTLHNTLSRTREPFVPADPRRVTMYVCGPTVYNFAHIGNARPPVVFDVLARLLRSRYPLTYVRNVTDVDDKINNAAREEGVEIGVLTARYLDAYLADMTSLGVAAPDVAPRVTSHLPEIVGMIERLIAAGHAYEAEGHVLFDVPSYAAYGKLSGRDTDELVAGARVDVAPYKRYAGDFVLWKPSPPDIVGWSSPWGRGRPGRHIECSAMVERHLGETIDIHGGGVDLVFPHHENEVAQSTCAHPGKTYARFWVHNGLVVVNGEKMSKSLANFVLWRDVLAEHGAESVRLALLKVHYRQPLDWTGSLVGEARQNLDRLYGVSRDACVTAAAVVRDAAVDVPPGVLVALEDDLNTPLALSELLGVARSINTSGDDAERGRLAGTLRAGG